MPLLPLHPCPGLADVGMGPQDHVGSAVGKDLGPGGLRLVGRLGVLVAPVDEDQHRVGRRPGRPQVRSDLGLVVQGVEDIGRVLGQGVAVGGLGIAQDRNPDSVPLQHCIGPVGPVGLRLDAGADHLPEQSGGPVNSLQAPVQGVVAGAADDIKARGENGLPRLRGGAEDGVGPVVRRIVHQGRLQVQGRDVIGGQDRLQLREHAAEAAVLRPEIIVIDLPVDQQLPQDRHGDGLRPQLDPLQAPGQPVPGGLRAGAVRNHQPGGLAEPPGFGLQADIRGHPPGPDGLAQVIDVDVLGPPVPVLGLGHPEGAAFPVAALPPREQQQLRFSVPVHIRRQGVLNPGVRVRLPCLPCPGPRDPATVQGHRPVSRRQRPALPFHPVRRSSPGAYAQP